MMVRFCLLIGIVLARPAIAETNATPPMPPDNALPRLSSITEINVRDFGARGDGVADDHEAITRALAAAAFKSRLDNLEAAAATVVFPPGHYRVTQPLSLTPNHRCLVLAGTGGVDSFGANPGSDYRRHPRAATQIFYDGPEGGILIDVSGAGGLQLRNLGLIGNDKARVLFRVNSPRGAGAGRYTFHNVVFAAADTGIETGALRNANAADMSFYDVLFNQLRTGFRAMAGQSVDFAFFRLHARRCGTVFHFQEGSSFYAAMASIIGCDLAMQIDTGGHAGTFCFDTLHIEQGPYQILKAKGLTTVTFNALNTHSQRKNRQEGFDLPLFELDSTTVVLINGAHITNGPIAHLRGKSFIRFDGCRFVTFPGHNVDPRDPVNLVRHSETAGYEVSNSFHGDTFIRSWIVGLPGSPLPGAAREDVPAAPAIAPPATPTP